MTMNDTWGFKKNDQNWKSTQTLIRNLIDCASKGGNYLLNVGPSGEGLIPAASVQRLAEIGQWMQVNSEAVYDTQASPFKRLAWGRCTTKVTPEGAMLYLHVFDWPRDGKLVVPGLKNKAQAAYLLADSKHQALRTKSSDNGLTITVPTAAPDANSSTLVLKVKGALDIVVMPLTQNADGSLELHAYDAICHGNQIRYEAAANKDAIGYWLDPDAWVEWQFDMKRIGKYTVVMAMSAMESGNFVIEMGGQKLRGTAPKTGDYSKLQEVELGTIELTSVGKMALSVKAVKEGWQPLNLRSVRLRPVK
jgi:alpha-L-fucosidase